jgi:phosphorylase/glycogen(starch) synthase
VSQAVFEVSWEVCNKVGGIYTVVSGKVPTLVERFGDDYVAVGPWLLTGGEVAEFEPDPGFDDYAARCRERGLEVRVGRWTIPGHPRAVLVEFSRLYEIKDGILAGMWERHRVDSLRGGWDYAEPVLFGYAAGIAIELWADAFLTPRRREAAAIFHEWMTGSGLLYLRDRAPAVGTLFVTHATVLGRAIGSSGTTAVAAAGQRTPEEISREIGVPAKHSLEAATARIADVFATVSPITAEEAHTVLGRDADPILPNGLDLDVVDALRGEVPRDEVREALARVAEALLGEDPRASAFLCTSGRYEFVNKGLDVLLESLAELEREAGTGVVLFVLVPAGSAGWRTEMRQRLTGKQPADGPLRGPVTHQLVDWDGDPVQRASAALGFDNAPGRRVRIVHVPIYLDGKDEFLPHSYEAVLAAMDLSCFPSFYEPWGYTPAESIAVGVPTVTTDYAGFGRWTADSGLGPDDGIFVLPRAGRAHADAVSGLAAWLGAFLRDRPDREALAAACRRTAERLSWDVLIEPYLEALRSAEERSAERRRERIVAPLWESRPLERGVVMKPRIERFDVAAELPRELLPLRHLAQNLWWSWDPDAPALFADLSPDVWRETGHNPIALLRRARADDLAERADDPAYLARIDAVVQRFETYLLAPRKTPENGPIAYFCLEFGLHESLPIYSGGLGILAGDHMKAASDLGLPLVGVGLFYREGYLRQTLGPGGGQIDAPERNDPVDLPLRVVPGQDELPLEVGVRVPGGTVQLRAWELRVGRIPVYLLDADIPANREEHRRITRRLYPADRETRLLQEILLGKGGMRFLRAADQKPSVLHLNEGHAAFAPLERLSHLVRTPGLAFPEALEAVRASTAFTTHTPVPAGHDVFHEDLLRRHFSDTVDWIGASWESFLELGGAGGAREFNMTHLACNLAGSVNGVSRRHAEVTRELLHPLWPESLVSEVPVRPVTNGVHLASWTHPDLVRLLGVADRPITRKDFRSRAAELGDRDLWELRISANVRLRAEIRRRLVEPGHRGLGRGVLRRALDRLQRPALTIGFARRFAPYKRADLLFTDPERLDRLLSDDGRPGLVVIAGKAHPADGQGQDLLRRIVEISRSERFAGKVIFLEGYDLDLARELVQGVDVWLNTPTPPLEACGTSGMKAAANGVLNLSIADGWWAEVEHDHGGWTIRPRRLTGEEDLRDALDAEALLDLLEVEVFPLFYDRDPLGLPRRWLRRVREALEFLPPEFSAERMVDQYWREIYSPLVRRQSDVAMSDYQAARAAAEERRRRRAAFDGARVLAAGHTDLAELKLGDALRAWMEVRLDGLAPEDVRAELVYGGVASDADLAEPRVVALEREEGPTADAIRFEGVLSLDEVGTRGIGIRLRLVEDGPLQPGTGRVVWLGPR